MWTRWSGSVCLISLAIVVVTIIIAFRAAGAAQAQSQQGLSGQGLQYNVVLDILRDECAIVPGAALGMVQQVPACLDSSGRRGL
jgi:hypothetical protein